jgi:CubicO group peptidase (beta-lactamase class C family)
MLLNGGLQDGTRILSPSSVQEMTRDHLTPEQKAASDFFPGFWDTRGWGFCMSVNTRQDDAGRKAGAYGWDGGLGSVWYSDPSEDLVTILMTQRAWESPNPPAVCLDFWRSAYAALDG